MRLLAYLADPPSSGSSRYRVCQFRQALAQAGIELTVSSPAPEALFARLSRTNSYWVKLCYYGVFLVRRILDVLSAPRFDVVLVQRDLFPYGPPLLEWCLLRLNRRVLYDTDDANFHRPSFAPANVFQRFRWQRKYEVIMRGASRVTVVNSYIADHVRSFNPHVRVVPMAIDITAYRSVPRQRRNDELVIGWNGTKGALAYLEMLREVLADLSRRYQFRVRVITGSPAPPDLAGTKVELVPWTAEGEIGALAGIDIGVVPLADGPFERGKFPFKLLQFMTLGVPVVASDLGTPREIIEHGVNGFLARTDGQWADALATLLEDAARRRVVGERGRQVVESRYSLNAVARSLIEELHAAAATPPLHK